MYNKQVLSEAWANLQKRKARLTQPKDIIVDPRGQYNHPGEITRIPGEDITMANVPYPVMAYPNIGQPQMMYPEQDYNFPGADYVDEHPMMQDGGPNTPEQWVSEIRDLEREIGAPDQWTLKSYNLLQNKLNSYKNWRETTPEGQAVYDSSNKEGEYNIPLPEHLQGATNTMMKARLAYANQFGNPAAQRMVVPTAPREQRPTGLTRQVPKTQWKQLPDGTWYKDTKAGQNTTVESTGTDIGGRKLKKGGSIQKFQTGDEKRLTPEELIGNQQEDIWGKMRKEFDKVDTEKRINETNKDVINYYNQYMRSPRYKEMLGPNPDIDIQRRYNLGDYLDKIPKLTVAETQPDNRPSTGGYSRSDSGEITILPKGYSVKGLLPHEWSHSIDRPGKFYQERAIPKKDIDYINKVTLPDSKILELPRLSNYAGYTINELREEYPEWLKTEIEWKNYVSEPTEVRARLNDIRYQAKKRKLYDPFTQKVTPDIYKKLLNTKFETDDEEGFDALKQLKDIYTDEQILYMLNNISQKENLQNEELNVAQNGGTIPKFQIAGQKRLTPKELIAAQREQQLQNNRVYTLANDQKFIDGVSNWAMYSSNPDKISSEYNDQIKRYLYSGNYGYNPVSGTLYKLKKEQRTVADAETKKILAKQDDKAAHRQSIIDAGFDLETFGKSKGTNFITGEQIYGDKSQEDVDKINKEAINNFITEGHKKTILNTPFNIAAAFTPVGAVASTMQGIADASLEASQGNYGTAALYAGLETLPLVGMVGKSALKNAYKLNPQALKETPEVIMYRTQKPGQTEELMELKKLQQKKETLLLEDYDTQIKNATKAIIEDKESPLLSRYFNTEEFTDDFNLKVGNRDYRGNYTEGRRTKHFGSPTAAGAAMGKTNYDLMFVSTLDKIKKASGAHLRDPSPGDTYFYNLSDKFVLPNDGVFFTSNPETYKNLYNQGRKVKLVDNVTLANEELGVNADKLLDSWQKYHDLSGEGVSKGSLIPNFKRDYIKERFNQYAHGNDVLSSLESLSSIGHTKNEILNPDNLEQFANLPVKVREAELKKLKDFYKEKVLKSKSYDDSFKFNYNDVITTLEKTHKTQGLKGAEYQQGGSIDIELTDEEIDNYRRGGYIVEELPKAQKGLFNFSEPDEYVGYQGNIPIAESTTVANTYRPTQQEIKATKEYTQKVGATAQAIRNKTGISQKEAMQQAEQVLEANSRVPSEAKPYANTKQAQERDAYVFDEGMNVRDYFRYPLQFLAGRTPTEEERIQDRIRITDPRTSNWDKFMGTAGQAMGLAPEALINTGVGLAFAPANLSKLGMVADAVSPVGSIKMPSSITKSVNDFKSNFSSALKGTSSTLSQIIGELKQGKLNKKSIAEGNKWLQEWINSPYTQQKIYDDVNAAKNIVNLYKDPENLAKPKELLELLDLVEYQSRTFTPNSKEYSLVKQFKDNLEQYTKVLGFNKSKTIVPIHSGNWGVSYQHGYHPNFRQTILDNPKTAPDRYGSWISRTPSLSPKKRIGTTIHEGTHDWVSSRAFTIPHSGMRGLSLRNTDPKIKEDFYEWEKLRKEGKDPGKVMGQNKAYQAYLADPTEMHARIMELRKNLNLSPEIVIDDNYADQIIQYLKSLPKNKQPIDVKGFLNVLGNDQKEQPKRLAELFNKFWVAAPAAIATGAAASSNEYQQGGIVLDLSEDEIRKYQEAGYVIEEL